MAKKNKNKIQILDSNQDLNTLFDDKPESETAQDESDDALNKFPSHEPGIGTEMSDKEFAQLLDNSLKGKSMDKMMQEKKERGASKSVPLSKRLKRYPPAESKLDLHGFTSDGATLKADAFIRNAFGNGFFTLKIVVGKGLHSEFGPVLPDVIHDLLLKLKDEKIVLHFIWEKKKKTKSGAIIVYLNQFND